MSEASVIENFLIMEELMVDRLRLALPPEVYVLTAPDMGAVQEANQPTPAVQIIFSGYQTAQGAQPGYAHLDQIWWTVVAVRNAASVTSGAGARLDAGPLLGKIIKSLGVWVPPFKGAKTLTLDPSPGTRYTGAFGYYPLAWRVSFKERILF